LGRTIIVGDVHGCRAELDWLLDRARFEAGDRLILVGDLVARGPDSLGVLDIARRTGAIIVRGNHEQKLLDSRHAPVGRLHREVARSLRPVDWTLLETSPLSLDLPEHGLRVVHAGVMPGQSWAQQRREILLNIRTILYKQRKVLWGTRYAGPPHIVFGHHASPGLQLHPWATGLDTGCVYGGRLTAIVLAHGQRMPRAPAQRRLLLVSQQAARVYFDPERRKRVA
jgi:hypothetical protein